MCSSLQCWWQLSWAQAVNIFNQAAAAAAVAAAAAASSAAVCNSVQLSGGTWQVLKSNVLVFC
jgi:hypothetical protein